MKGFQEGTESGDGFGAKGRTTALAACRRTLSTNSTCRKRVGGDAEGGYEERDSGHACGSKSGTAALAICRRTSSTHGTCRKRVGGDAEGRYEERDQGWKGPHRRTDKLQAHLIHKRHLQGKKGGCGGARLEGVQQGIESGITDPVARGAAMHRPPAATPHSQRAPASLEGGTGLGWATDWGRQALAQGTGRVGEAAATHRPPAATPQILPPRHPACPAHPGPLTPSRACISCRAHLDHFS